MRRFLYLSALLLMAGAATSDGQTTSASQISTFKSGLWSGGGYILNGAFAYCAMGSQYASGNSLAFSISANGHWSLALMNPNVHLQIGAPVVLQASVNGNNPVPIRGVAATPSIIRFDFGDKSELDFYKNAARLRLYIQGAQSIAFDLTNLAAATDALEACYRRQG